MAYNYYEKAYAKEDLSKCVSETRIELTVEEAKGLRDMYLAFAEAVKCSLGPASHPLVDAQAKYFSEMLTTRISRAEDKDV